MAGNSRHGAPPVCPHLQDVRRGTWASPDGSSTEYKDSLWAHDYLVERYLKVLPKEQIQVLSAWEGLDRLYFFLLQQNSQKNIWAKIIGYIDRVSGAACGIEGVAGMTPAEAASAKLKRGRIERGSEEEPDQHKIEIVSAITGLMTLNALSIIQQERPDLVQRLITELPSCDAVPAKYKPDTKLILQNMSCPFDTTGKPRILDFAQQRVTSILGPLKMNVIGGLTKGVVRSMVKGLYKAMS